MWKHTSSHTHSNIHVYINLHTSTRLEREHRIRKTRYPEVMNAFIDHQFPEMIFSYSTFPMKEELSKEKVTSSEKLSSKFLVLSCECFPLKIP